MAPSAKLINTLYDYIASNSPDFMQKGDTDELVLLSHSLGGFIAFKTLAGKAAAPGRSPTELCCWLADAQ